MRTLPQQLSWVRQRIRASFCLRRFCFFCTFYSYTEAVLACGSMVRFFFCRLCFARRAKHNLQGVKNLQSAIKGEANS
jgi:hypothetical protein